MGRASACWVKVWDLIPIGRRYLLRGFLTTRILFTPLLERKKYSLSASFRKKKRHLEPAVCKILKMSFSWGLVNVDETKKENKHIIIINLISRKHGIGEKRWQTIRIIPSLKKVSEEYINFVPKGDSKGETNIYFLLIWLKRFNELQDIGKPILIILALG